MKLKTVSCTQFAGILNRDVSFSDGINVLYGKNESGKSTTVNLIARTLFQKAKLDGRRDKEFYELYFPGARKNGTVSGDFADGKLTFETEQGTYTLTKEWGADPRCMLSTPDGVVRDQKKIDEILKEALLYGEGVYADLLFSSQKNADISLQTLLDSAKSTDAKAEITNAVSQAFAESDGVSVDAIEQAIQGKIDEIAGKHWDVEQAAPVRKTGRWSTGLGEILKAYYAAEDAKLALDKLSQLSDEADRTAKHYTDCVSEAQRAEHAYNQFNGFADKLKLQRERKDRIALQQAELRKLQEALASWPVLERQLTRATALQAEKTSRELFEQYCEAKKIAEQIQILSERANKPCPTEGEIRQVQMAQREMNRLENALRGMNINAAVQMLGGNTVEITSVLTGQKIDITDGTAAIREAVKLTVPGVMELQLSPADVDVTETETKLREKQCEIREIYAKYSVDSLDALNSLALELTRAKAELKNAQERLAVRLGAVEFAELEEKAASLPPDLRTMNDISNDILSLCGNAGISGFIAQRQMRINDYHNAYGSATDLSERVTACTDSLAEAEQSLAEIGEIPAEYATVANPSAHLDSLRQNMEQKRQQRDNALQEKTAAETALENYREYSTDDLNAEYEETQRVLAEQKSLLAHWLHIQEVFFAQKETLGANPMQDIADSFTRYLGVISGGRVSSEFPQGDKLAMQVYSGDRVMDFHKLSEGTKETVSLAFRLAVLDHLFPNGGGVIVLDDPFTDMDAERTAQGCELLKECAKRHQVIFLTCHEAYIGQLGGNAIRI